MALFTVYSSSAGSGKTFTLTKEYLKLALSQANPTYFKRILAMTFTNAAANEMKERIIKTLVDLANTVDKSSTIEIQLLEELPNISKEELKLRAKNTLNEITQDYNLFAVKTLDSFVNQVVSSFTFDLDLPYNYSIILNTDDVIDEAVNNLLDRVGSEAELTKMFSDFALNLIEEDRAWSQLKKNVAEFGKNLFKSNNAEEISKNSSLTHADVMEIKRNIYTYFREAEAQANSLASKAMDLIHSKNLVATDFSYGEKGVYGFFKKISVNSKVLFDKKLGISYATNAFNEGKWTSKKFINWGIEEIKVELAEIGNDLLALRTDKYYILKIINKNLLNIPFLSIIKQEIDDIILKRNEVILADFNQRILDIVSTEPVPYIYERIGERYHHILVDEFQDTSDTQFFNLLPLFENNIAKNHNNLIVGDPKQAIYGWRGGNVLLMLDLIGKKTEYIDQKAPVLQLEQAKSIIPNIGLLNLSTNYRSSENIIAFNNEFFEYVKTQHQSGIIAEVFSDAFQNTPQPPKPGGLVEIQLDVKEEDLEAKISQILSTLINDGFEPQDIAILCRKGKEVKVVGEVLKNIGYEIDSKEALLLNNNLSIKCLISGLRLFLNQEGVFEKFEFLQFILKIRGISTSHLNLNEICTSSTDKFLSYLVNFGINLEVVKTNPYEILEYLVEKLHLLKNKKNQSYLFTLLDFALDFTNNQSKDLNAFLDIWEQKKETLTIASKEGNAIKVSTIHKSKGLEYPVVILPFVTWDIVPSNQGRKNEIWLDVEVLDYPELRATNGGAICSAPFGYNDEFDFSKERFGKEKESYLAEQLNLLYVAFTRPTQRLYLWCEGGEKGVFKGVSNYIKGFLDHQGEFQQNKTSYVFGLAKPYSTDTKIEKELIEISLPIIFEDEHEMKVVPSLEDEEIRKGNILHAVFEKIIFNVDVERALEEVTLHEELSSEQQNEILEKVNKVLQHDLLKPLFAETVRVKTEVEILAQGTKVHRPDRIVFVEDKVYLVDYKTGLKRKLHQEQLKQYAALLQEMGYTQVVTYLVYFEPFEVVVL